MSTIDLLAAATFSPDRKYRYTLRRAISMSPGTLCFVMLNPSTADETADDPTIRRCMGFAKKWDFGNLLIVNMFALRSTDPQKLYGMVDPIGPDNDDVLFHAFMNADRIITAWGNHGSHLGRDSQVQSIAQSASRELMALRLTKVGQPEHPLYLPASLEPIKFTARTTAPVD